MAARQSGADRTFEHLDRDGDGRVTGRDFERTAQAIVEAFGVDESSAKAIRLLEGYRRACELVFDEVGVDRDDGVGRDGFTGALVTLFGTVSSAPLRGACAAEFAAADQDDDGTITRAEFARLLAAMGAPGHDADAAFDALDRDRDGRVTRDEYVAAWEDYLVSDEPDPAGARVFAGL